MKSSLTFGRLAAGGPPPTAPPVAAAPVSDPASVLTRETAVNTEPSEAETSGRDGIGSDGSDRIDWIGSNRIGSDRMDRIGSGRIRSDRIGLDGFDRIGSD